LKLVHDVDIHNRGVFIRPRIFIKKLAFDDLQSNLNIYKPLRFINIPNFWGYWMLLHFSLIILSSWKSWPYHAEIYWATRQIFYLIICFELFHIKVKQLKMGLKIKNPFAIYFSKACWSNHLVKKKTPRFYPPQTSHIYIIRISEVGAGQGHTFIIQALIWGILN
jgi:hypothetical protein